MSKTTDEVLRAFLLAPKPDWTIPADVCVISQLILQDGQPVSWDELALRCGLSDAKAIVRSIQKLRPSGWIVRHPSNPKVFIVDVEKLPQVKI
jgi:SOS-response transcriptional repressor LexA